MGALLNRDCRSWSPSAPRPIRSAGVWWTWQKLFSDPDKLPTTYDAWLERAERVERQFKKAGFTVARIWIRPVSFAAWCKERNVSPDQAARLIFANEAARCPRAQP